MKINRNINTTIITDNDLQTLKSLADEIIISDVNDIFNINDKFIIFNDVLRYLSNKEKETLPKNLDSKNIHFVNITSNIEECLLADSLIIIKDEKVIIEGPTLSVLKEEKILKRCGVALPFIIDLSLQLNYYGLIDSVFLDEESLVNKLW